jgi:hypothetical protein
MAKIFDVQFTKGSLVEKVTNEVMTVATIPFADTEKGMALYNTNSGAAGYAFTQQTIDTTNFTIIWACKKSVISQTGGIIGNISNNTHNSLYYIGTGIRFESNTNGTQVSITNFQEDNLWHHCALVSTAGTFKAYLDGKEVSM